MDVDRIFKPIDSGTPQEAGVQVETPANPIKTAPPEELPSAPPPSPFVKVLKIFLGLAVILGIFLFVWSVILPKLLPGKVGQVKLVYWGLFEDQAIIAPTIEDFEKKHPNIKIEYAMQDLDQYRERLVTRSNNGNGPDIYKFHNTWFPQLSDLLLPLPDSVVTKEDFSKNYYPVVKSDLMRNDAIYGIPLGIDTLNLYINKDMFQAAGLKAPTSWIEFSNFARQLTVKDSNKNIKTSGAAMGTFDNVTHAPDIISMLFAQNGVNLKDISSNVSAASDALNFYSSFALPDANVWDETFDDSIKAFASGTLAMYFGYSKDFFTIKALNPNLSFEIHPVPALPGQKATIASYWVDGISSKTKYQEQAAQFMNYLAQKETAEKLFREQSKKRNFGEPFARIDLADSLSSSVVFPFLSSASSAVSSYFVDGTLDAGLNEKMNQVLKIAVNSILKGNSPEAASQSLSQTTAQILRSYGQ